MTTTQIVQLPPDGVGKKIRHRVIHDLKVTPVTTPAVGTVVKGTVSLATGTITGTYSSSSDTTYFIGDASNAMFTTSDTLVDNVTGTVYASAVASVASNVYVASSTISDPKTPEYVLSINKRGAAYTTFPEGTPQFDSFGHMQVSQMQAVGEYYAVQQDQPTYIPKWWTSTNASGVNGTGPGGVITGSATGYPVTDPYVTFQANTQGVTGGVNPVWRANTAASGSFANVAFNPNLSVITMSVGTGRYDQSLRRTNQYHPNKPGVSQLIYLSVTAAVTGANGPTAGTTPDGTQATPGQNGVTREWGYFDRYNGFGFRLRDQKMYVFLRTSGNVAASTGTVPSDLEIPQSLWNINTLQSSTTSDFYLDPTKENIYWMDMAYSAGQVILGVVSPDGRRVQCHQYQFGNGTYVPALTAANFGGQGLVPFMQTGTLPITLNIYNNGNATPGYGSALNWSWGVVFTESADLQYTGTQIHVFPLDGPRIITSNTTSNVWSSTAGAWSYGSYQPLLSFTPKPMVNGLRNNMIGIHESFDFCSNGASSIHVGICVFYGNAAANLRLANGTSDPYWSEGLSLVPQSLLRMDTSAMSMNQNYYSPPTGSLLTNYFMIESFIAPANSSIRYALGDRMYKSFWLPAFCDIQAGTGVNGAGNNDGVALDPNTYPIFTFACRALTPGVNPGAYYTKYWKEIR